MVADGGNSKGDLANLTQLVSTQAIQQDHW